MKPTLPRNETDENITDEQRAALTEAFMSMPQQEREALLERMQDHHLRRLSITPSKENHAKLNLFVQMQDLEKKSMSMNREDYVKEFMELWRTAVSMHNPEHEEVTPKPEELILKALKGEPLTVNAMVNYRFCQGEVKYGDQYTPLMLAAQYGMLPIVEAILATSEVDVHAVNDKGKTA